MKVYIFSCTTNSKLFGFTADSTGTNLPKGDICKGEWKLFNTIQDLKPTDPLIGASPVEILRDISTKGYFIGSYRVTTSERIEKI